MRKLKYARQRMKTFFSDKQNLHLQLESQREDIIRLASFVSLLKVYFIVLAFSATFFSLECLTLTVFKRMLRQCLVLFREIIILILKHLRQFNVYKIRKSLKICFHQIRKLARQRAS